MHVDTTLCILRWRGAAGQEPEDSGAELMLSVQSERTQSAGTSSRPARSARRRQVLAPGGHA